MWAKILKFAAKYGTKAIKWAWAHKAELLAAGEAAYELIKKIFG